jgi:multicomponent Na+:H+ antiporter subunit D
MAIYGVVYAFLSDDYRRLLSYHIVSQVGFMVAGIGIGTDMALNGAVAHAFSHILYKGLLFMAAGSVLFVTGKRRLTDLGGLYKTMPVTFVMYMVGALSISGWPLLSGFVSKSMVISAASHDHRAAVFLILTLASVGTFLSLGLKLPYHMFFGHGARADEEGPPVSDPPKNMLVAMGLAAVLCALIGVFPSLLYGVLPHEVEYAPYTADHVTGALQLLLFTALGYMLLLKYAKAEASITLDTDWFYRKGSRVFMWVASRVVAGVDGFVAEIYERGILAPAGTLASWSSGFDIGVIDGMVNGVAYLTRLVSWVAHRFDIYIVDGLVNSAATLVGSLSASWRRLQTGYVQNYALLFVIGLIIIVGSVLLG